MSKNKKKEVVLEGRIEPVEGKTFAPEPVTIDELKRLYPEQIRQIETAAAGGTASNLGEKGFLLEIDDPFAAGTLRAYQKLKGLDGLKLPYVLPQKDKQTPEVLANYILRAEGAGDTARAIIARKELLKLAPEYFKKKTVNVQKSK